MIIFVCIKQQCYSKGTFFNVAELSNTESYFVFTGAVIIIVFAVIRLLLEVLQFCYDLVNYLIDWVNWIEVILYAVSIVFAFVFRTSCFCPQKWQWQVGVAAAAIVRGKAPPLRRSQRGCGIRCSRSARAEAR